MWHHNNKLSKNLAAIAAGSLITLSLQPFGYWPLAIVSSGILYLLVVSSNYKDTLTRCLWFSIGLFFSGASWVYVSIHEFGHVAIPLATLLTTLFCLGLAACNALILSGFAVIKSNKSCANIFIFAAVATASEALRSWLFTGFPWLFIGYSQTGFSLSGVAPLFGIYGLSFIIYANGAVLASSIILSRCKKTISIALLTTGLVWLAATTMKQINWTQATAEQLQVSMVQTNISQHDKWQRDNFDPTLTLYANMSQPFWQYSDLILWPEAAIPAYYHHVQQYMANINATALAHNSSLITGVPTAKKDSAGSAYLSYNSVVGLGNASGKYNKQQLVPFGEYIPFYPLLGKLMAFFELPLSRMQAGNSQQAPLIVDNWQTLPLVCYEMVYPRLVARAAKQSDVLITLSNDSWFGASLGPVQHLQMAQMRAIENGRYVLRSTGNGISAVIDEKGSLVATSKQFNREVLSAGFKRMQGQTPWTQYGYWLVHWLYGLPLFLRAVYLLIVRFKR